METEIRFSIIIPAYNVEDYIERAIESVKKQTFSSYELIVIDDCSQDGTREKIEKYNDIIYIKHSENKGAGGARNSGLSVAKGEYVLFIDGDDYLNNEYVLEKLDNLIGKQQVDLIYMGFELKGNRYELVVPTKENYRMLEEKYPNIWSKCWNRSFLEKNNMRFPEKRYYEDVLFIYKGLVEMKTYLVAEFPVHTYISGRKNSVTTTLKFKNVYDTIKNIEDLIELKKEEKTKRKELDARIQKEINMCKQRLEDIVKEK